MATPTLSAVRSLQQEMKKIQEEPVEGFTVRLPDDSNIFLWEVAIFGPPETLYEGGYFKVLFFHLYKLEIIEFIFCLIIKAKVFPHCLLDQPEQKNFIIRSLLCAIYFVRM